MTRTWALAACLAFLLSACGSNDLTVEGELSIGGSGATGERDGDACEGEDGFDDMREGANVVVLDSEDKKVGIGELSAGTFNSDTFRCEFTFEVEDVPAGSGIYSVTIGNRSAYEFSEDEAGELALSLD